VPKFTINLNEPLDCLVDQSEFILQRDESLFQKSGEIVHLVHDKDGYSIRPLKSSLLCYKLSQLCNFYKEDRDVHPPGKVARCILDKGAWPGFRRLRAIASFPPLHHSGNLISQKGYHESTGVFYTGSAQCNVPNRPSLNDAKKAVEALLDIVCDFPFATPGHRSAWLASVLTPLARFAHDGNAPLTVIEANTPRAGKTRLAKLIPFIAMGEECPIVMHTQNQEEERKSIMSYLRARRSIVIIDNIVGEYGGATVNALATSRTIEGRVVGSNRIMNVVNDTSWILTGNNVILAPDTAERCLHVRLFCKDEKPHLRDGWKYPDLFKTVKEKRNELLSAALTILKAYILAGRPSQKIPAWGSFEEWSALVRGCLVWAGQPDPAESRAELEAQADTGKQAIAELIDGWSELQQEVNAPEGMKTQEAWAYLFRGKGNKLKSALEARYESKGIPTPKHISRWLRDVKERNCGGRMLVCKEDPSHGHKWYVKSIA
jgi:hypothetical protein